MNKALSTILLLATGLIIFIVGGGLGMSYQAQKDALQVKKGEAADQLTRAIPAIVAYGQAEKVEGQYLTLSYDGESITIKIKEGAKIYFFDPSNKIASQDATLSDIKIGDTLDVTVRINSNGEVEGSNVAIIIKT